MSCAVGAKASEQLKLEVGTNSDTVEKSSSFRTTCLPIREAHSQSGPSKRISGGGLVESSDFESGLADQREDRLSCRILCVFITTKQGSAESQRDQWPLPPLFPCGQELIASAHLGPSGNSSTCL